MNIGIIGAGISGLGAAWLLHPHHDITVYEQHPRAGGHSHTCDAQVKGQVIPVDTGFIVFNHRNYPHLTRLFDHLQVATEKSDMSFGVSIGGGALEYAGRNLRALAAQPANLLKPSFLRLLADIVRFNRHATRDAVSHAPLDLSLGEYCAHLKVGTLFTRAYLLPMGAAIWSSSLPQMLAFPASTFIRFFHNHGLLTLTDQPQWYTVSGGSREYVKKLMAPFEQKVRLACPVQSVRRVADGVSVRDVTGEEALFDQVILASHPDQSLAMIDTPTPEETAILGAFAYQPNHAALHSDPSFMPQRKAAWASWNYCAQAVDARTPHITLTYWMNLLQNIPHALPVFVTLNPSRPPDPALTHGVYHYEHPVFDERAIAAQKNIPSIQGKDRIWYAGAWQGYGFHEDGFASALRVAGALGAMAPWQAA